MYLSGKRPVGETVSGKRPVGETVVGETVVGETSRSSFCEAEYDLEY
nr:7145_t:CDS:2 [Entrophospora candida]